MKRISFADSTLLVDDDTSDALVEYAALLGAAQSSDSVRIYAIGDDVDDVEADLVLNAASNLLAESTHSSLTAPANEKAVAYMREQISVLRHGVPAAPARVDDRPENEYFEEDFTY